MSRKQIKKDLESILSIVSKFNEDFAYIKLYEDYEKRMKQNKDVDSYLQFLSVNLLELARGEKERNDLYYSGQRVARRLAHRIYREYNDGRKKEGFLSLVG